MKCLITFFLTFISCVLFLSKQSYAFSDNLGFVNYFSEKNHVFLLIEGDLNISNTKQNNLNDFCSSNNLTRSNFSSSNILILEQEFGSSEVIPSMTYSEIKMYVDDINNFLSPWKNTVPINRRLLAENLSSSLSRDTEKEVSIPISNLSRQQREKINSWIVSNYIDDQINQLNIDGFSLLANSKILNQDSLGYCVYSGKNYYPLKYFLSPAKPIALPEKTKLTIQDLSEKLEKRFSCKIEVDACLQDKPIFFVGEQYSSPQAILQSLARFFNLRYVKNNNIYYLKRKKIQPSTKISQVYTNIFEAMPSPLMRSIIVPAKTDIHQMKSGNASLSRQSQQQISNALNYYGSIIYNDIKINQLNRTPIRYFSNLNVKSKTCYGLIRIHDFVHTISQLYNVPPPKYILQYDDMFVNVLPQGTNRFLFLSLPGVNGKQRSITGIIFPKESYAEERKRRVR